MPVSRIYRRLRSEGKCTSCRAPCTSAHCSYCKAKERARVKARDEELRTWLMRGPAQRSNGAKQNSRGRGRVECGQAATARRAEAGDQEGAGR